jgi:DNA-binding NarL/FixJ family response regulator
MHRAVGVVIVDEPYGLDSTLRASLDQASVLRTLSEADLSRVGATLPEALVALVTVRTGQAEASADRIEDLRSRYPSLKVAAVFEVLDSGAIGRLVAAGVDVLVARSASAGVVCTTLLGLAGLAAAEPSPAPSADGLTPREAEILRFLSAGFSNKEVARRLGLSVRTVETHRLNLRRKTQTGRLKDLVALARQLGLAPVTEVESATTARRPAAPYAGMFAPAAPLTV